jgi:hypothetical protein
MFMGAKYAARTRRREPASVESGDHRVIRSAAVLLIAVAAAPCVGSSSPPGSAAPGTATLDIQARWTSCSSIGGCDFVARLATPAELAVPDQAWEAQFVANAHTPDLALTDGLPPVLGAGTYRFTFFARLMSDAISNGVPTSFGQGSCTAVFAVGPGRSVIAVRVEFASDRCTVSLTKQEDQ